MSQPRSSLADKPSIAVLPFQNMSGDPEQEYFADGIVEDIITALSHFKALFVIARNSSFTYKGRAVDVKQVGRDLGCVTCSKGVFAKRQTEYALQDSSSIPPLGHIFGQTGLMAGSATSSIQDQVTESVVGAMAPVVEKAEIERAKRKPTEKSRRLCHLFTRFGQALSVC